MSYSLKLYVGSAWQDISDYVDITNSVFPIQEHTDRGEPVISTFDLSIFDKIPYALTVGADVRLFLDSVVLKKYVITKANRDIETSFWTVSLSYAYQKLTVKKICSSVLQAQLDASNMAFNYSTDNTGHENVTYLYLLQCMFQACGFPLSIMPDVWKAVIFNIDLTSGLPMTGSTQIELAQVCLDMQMVWALNQDTIFHGAGSVNDKAVNVLRPYLWDFVRMTLPIFKLTIIDDPDNPDGYRLIRNDWLPLITVDCNYLYKSQIFGYQTAGQPAQGDGVSVGFKAANRSDYYTYTFAAKIDPSIQRDYVESAASNDLLSLDWYNNLRFLFRTSPSPSDYIHVYMIGDDCIWFDMVDYATHGRLCVVRILSDYTLQTITGAISIGHYFQVLSLQYDLNGEFMLITQNV